ncbi:uncharacterized protein B0H18DRAFT_954130 [Fomitopsis serialis]|uniref:uncharacterized protein n=1 Tax=Fomitopsis serialis TaxID=139415 RepID=UPI00200821E7|nr:uncharacterized protein B0H18DRAFT_954130 [Neoantrodia serialis]KAH9928146.1 hypothetical protein B0H18DRAFT_954130 [Neoantrodia serialis]
MSLPLCTVLLHSHRPCLCVLPSPSRQCRGSTNGVREGAWLGGLQEDATRRGCHAEFLFSSWRQAIGVIVKLDDSGHRAYLKGASEISARKKLRATALPYRDFESWPPARAPYAAKDEAEYEDMAQDLTLEDLLREGVRDAVADCFQAGVPVKISARATTSLRRVHSRCSVACSPKAAGDRTVIRTSSRASHGTTTYMGIMLIEIGVQILLVFVGGTAISVTRIGGAEWGDSLALGLVSIPLGVPTRYVHSEPVERLLKALHIMSNPIILPTTHTAGDWNTAIESVRDNLRTFAAVVCRHLSDRAPLSPNGLADPAQFDLLKSFVVLWEG